MELSECRKRIDEINEEIFIGDDDFESPRESEEIIAFDLPEDFGLEDEELPESAEIKGLQDEDEENSTEVDKIEQEENGDSTIVDDAIMSPDELAKLLSESEN